MQTGAVPDAAITASSSYSGLPAIAGRLNSQGTGMTAWGAQNNGLSDYLQIDFGKMVKITRIATQGRYDANQWVTQYILFSSLDGSAYQAYEKGKVTGFSLSFVTSNSQHVCLYTFPCTPWCKINGKGTGGWGISKILKFVK